MVWKGHYLGYGPADVMLHVPVDNHLMTANPQVRIFAPYHVETVRLVRSARGIPSFDGIDALAGKKVGVEQVSIAGMVMLGEGNGRFRDNVRIYPSAIAALGELKAGALDAVLATRSEIESVIRGDPAFPVAEVPFERLPRAGWAIGMAVRKDDVELARRLQAAVNELAASGELKAIFARYGVQVVKP
jgi:ABC-type amino acid transport substrate-binding protein